MSEQKGRARNPSCMSKRLSTNLLSEIQTPGRALTMKEEIISDAGKGIGEKVIVGVLSAAILGGFALLWNWGSQGGLVRILGGVTPKDVAEIARAAATLPKGIVVASTQPCESLGSGWDPYTDANGRVIVGAGAHATSDQIGPLEALRPFDKAGDRRRRLSADEMPPHTHPITIGIARDPQSNVPWGIWVKEPLAGVLPMFTRSPEKQTEIQVTANKEVPIMPPYIALLFCRKT